MNLENKRAISSGKEIIKHLILWGVSQFCKLPLSIDRLWLSDKFYYKLKPKQTLKSLQIGDFKVIVDLADFQPRLMYFRHFERDIVKFIKNYLQKGQVCLDIGANIGFLSAVMANAVGKNGKVFSLEPNPKVFSFLKQVAESGTEVITPFQIAVSEKKGEMDFFIETDHMLSTSVEELRSRNSQRVSVETISVDDFCLSHKINPNFIKIDAEGAEPFVLKGMQGLFQKGLRPTILCEFKPWTYGALKILPEDVINLIMKYQYRAFILDDKANLIEISVKEICESKIDVNAIFLP